MSDIKDANRIKQIIDRREIGCLLHFTRLSNLESILEKGILTHEQIKEQGLNDALNDKQRWDGKKNATCCSIGFPNQFMFSEKRIEHKFQGKETEWVIIAISTDILLKKDCAFYPINAASNTVRHEDINDFKGVKAFESMFRESDKKQSNAEIKLPNKYITYPQAEVLVFSRIEQEHILAIYTNSKETAEAWRGKELGIEFIYRPEFFYTKYKWLDGDKFTGFVSIVRTSNKLMLRGNGDMNAPIQKYYIKNGVDTQGFVDWLYRLACNQRLDIEAEVPPLHYKEPIGKKLVPIIRSKTNGWLSISLEYVNRDPLNDLNTKPTHPPRSEEQRAAFRAKLKAKNPPKKRKKTYIIL